MALGFSTLVFLIFLLPGMFAVPGIYYSDRYSRHLVPQGLLAQMAILIIVAMFVHLVAFFFINRLMPPAFHAIPQIDVNMVLSFATFGNGVTDRQQIAGNVAEHVGWIMLYFLFTSASGFQVGYGFGKAILKGNLRFLANNAWLYETLEATHQTSTSREVWAYVLSHVEIGEMRVLYRGTVSHCQYSPEGKLAYVVLAYPCHGLLKAAPTVEAKQDDFRLLVSQGEQWEPLGGFVARGGDAKQRSQLYIEGQEIANVSFTAVPWHIHETELAELKKKAAEVQKSRSESDVQKNRSTPPPDEGALTQ